MDLTNQLKSDGTLTTWRRNSKGGYDMVVRRVELTEERKKELERLEERREKSSAAIDREIEARYTASAGITRMRSYNSLLKQEGLEVI